MVPVRSYAEETLSSVVDAVERAYNGFGKLTQETQTHGSFTGQTVNCTYESPRTAGNTIRRTSISYPGGQVVEVHYYGTLNNRLGRWAI